MIRGVSTPSVLVRWLTALVALLLTAFTVTSCASSDGERTTPETPDGARELYLNAFAALFSWRPETDRSPADAVKRATEYLSPSATKSATTFAQGEFENWADWKSENAKVTAAVTITPRPDEAPDDTDREVTRGVSVDQRVISQTGEVTETWSIKLPAVVAVKAAGQWIIKDLPNLTEARTLVCDSTTECATAAPTTTTTTTPPESKDGPAEVAPRATMSTTPRPKPSKSGTTKKSPAPNPVPLTDGPEPTVFCPPEYAFCQDPPFPVPPPGTPCPPDYPACVGTDPSAEQPAG